VRSESAVAQVGRWDAVAALALCAGIVVAWSFDRVSAGGTALDRALPLIATALALVAWTVRTSRWFVAIECAIPLLIASSVVISDPRFRAIAFGVVVAAAFCGALIAAGELTRWPAVAFVVAGVVLLRWIARDDVHLGREALIAIGCVLLALAFRQKRWGVAAALLAALVTPGIPSRTVAIPVLSAIVVRVISAIVRRTRAQPPAGSAVVDAAALLAMSGMLLLFAWSGVAARALPYFWRATAPRDRIPLHYALVPGQAIDIDVPEGAERLIVSAANALALRPGTVVGKIDPNTPIRIGDMADWGYARREQFWKSENVLPRYPAGTIHDYGYDAWIDGAGRIPLPAHALRIRVTAAASLPRDARLQIESIEMGQP
jgi:hypothetical protein